MKLCSIRCAHSKRNFNTWYPLNSTVHNQVKRVWNEFEISSCAAACETTVPTVTDRHAMALTSAHPCTSSSDWRCNSQQRNKVNNRRIDTNWCLRWVSPLPQPCGGGRPRLIKSDEGHWRMSSELTYWEQHWYKHVTMFINVDWLQAFQESVGINVDSAYGICVVIGQFFEVNTVTKSTRSTWSHQCTNNWHSIE